MKRSEVTEATCITQFFNRPLWLFNQLPAYIADPDFGKELHKGFTCPPLEKPAKRCPAQPHQVCNIFQGNGLSQMSEAIPVDFVDPLFVHSVYPIVEAH